MKDRNLNFARALFVLALLALIVAYVWFFYPALRTGIGSLHLENQVLEREKAEISQVMVDDAPIRAEISDLKARLEDKVEVGQITQASLMDDITAIAAELAIDLQSVTLGTPEPLGQSGTEGEQLLSLPVQISCQATYDGGMYFLAAFENSSHGTYHIDAFHFDATPEGYMPWTVTIRLLYYGTLPSVQPPADVSQEKP